MKVSYINPSMTGRPTRAPFEPLTFAALSALTPPDVERTLHDECLGPLPFDEPTDLVAISVSTYTARRAYQIARHYRRRGVPVVMGGYHPTVLPREALEAADAIVIGEAERVWASVVADFARGRPRRVYRGGCDSLAGLRFDRGIFAGKRYRPVRLVQFGRGCRFDCDFCSIPRFFRRRRMQRPVREVAAEVERLERGTIFFVDDNLHVGEHGTRALLDELAPLGRRWMCQASIDVAEDVDLVKRLARAGCFAVLMGFESMSGRTLERMHKTWHQGRSQYEELVHRLRDHGILVYGTFVLGYDDDTPDVVDATFDFAERAGLFLAAFNLLTPVPGTAIYRRLAAEGRLVGDPWWLHPATRFEHAVFTPAAMTRVELEAGARRIRRGFYGARSIARRLLVNPGLFRSPVKLGLFLATNVLYRAEVARLRDLPFGDPLDDAPLPLHAEAAPG